MAEGTQVGKAFIAIGADGSTISRDMDGIKETVLGALKSFAGPIAAALSVTGFTAIIKDAANFGDQMVKTSQKVGIAIGDLQRIKYVADLSGVSFQGMTTAMKTFATKMVETGKATGSMTDMLASVADEFANMEDGPKKTARAVELFGRAGLDMIPMLNQGSEAIRAQSKELDQLGAVMSEQTAKQAEIMNDNISRLQTALKGLGFTVAEAVIPALVDVTGKMVEWWKANQDFINQGLKTVMDDLKVSITGLIDPISKATTGMTGLNGAFEYAGAVIKIVTEGLLGIQLALTSAAWLGLQVPIHFLDSLTKSLQTLQRAVNAVFNPGGAAGNIPLADAISKYLLGPLDALSAKLGITTEEIKKSMVEVFFPLDTMLAASAHGPAMTGGGGGGGSTGSDKGGGSGKGGGLASKINAVGTALKGTTPAWIADYEAMSQWAAVAQEIQNMISTGALGSALPNTLPNIAANFGGQIQRDMSGLAGFGPDMFGPAAEAWDISKLFGSEAVTSVTEGAANVAAAMGTGMDGIIAEMQSRTPTLADLINETQYMLAGVFADWVTSGFEGGLGGLLKSMAKGFGKILASQGAFMFAEGFIEFLTGIMPPPFGPRPDLITHGSLMMAKGAAFMGGGALFSAAGASGGAGASYAAGAATTTTTAARPAVDTINYATTNALTASGAAGGGGNKSVTNVYINAVDTQSIKDAIYRGKDAVTGVVADDVAENGMLRQRLGLVFGA